MVPAVHRAGYGIIEPVKDVQQGGLPAARRAQKHVKLTLKQLKIPPAQSHEIDLPM